VVCICQRSFEFLLFLIEKVVFDTRKQRANRLSRGNPRSGRNSKEALEKGPCSSGLRAFFSINVEEFYDERAAGKTKNPRFKTQGRKEE